MEAEALTCEPNRLRVPTILAAIGLIDSRVSKGAFDRMVLRLYCSAGDGILL
jgi:hypothetical protein